MKKIFMHLDGDAFFASCEQAVNPRLRGKPIAVGAERSIATAFSYEAKALGVARGMPTYLIKKHFPKVIVVPSTYRLYAQMSKRMIAIVRRYTSVVEEYSIDECFADLSLCGSAEEAERKAREMQATIARELGLTVSVGLAHTKTLAKVASKMKKPAGLTSLLGDNESRAQEVAIGKVWGCGRKATELMHMHGIGTVRDFLSKDLGFVEKVFSKPMAELWYELSGRSVRPVEDSAAAQKSVSKTRTFFPASSARSKVFGELSENVEAATRVLREMKVAASHASIFIKTKDFRIISTECDFPLPVSTPGEVLSSLRPHFEKIFRAGLPYRATGVSFSNLRPQGASLDLFGGSDEVTDKLNAYKAIDRLEHRFGTGSIKLASSMAGHRGIVRRFLDIPSLGEVV